MTTDPLGTFRDDLIVAAARARPVRRRRRALLAFASVGAVAATALSLQPAERDRPDQEVVAGGPSTTARSTALAAVPSGPVWSIAAPAGWRRAGPELLPDLGSVSLTLATISLSDAQGGACPDVPTKALRSLGPQDVLVSVAFTGPADQGTPPWPEGGFDDAVLAITDPQRTDACGVPAALELRQGTWDLDGTGLTVLVAFGPDVPAERRADAWGALSSLRPGEGETAAPPVCVVTRPVEPGLTPPEAWPARPTSGVWYGTDDLWTALPTDGSSPTPRKSVWWSARFLGGGVEPNPEINVTWERLDQPAPVIQALSQGTNANTAAEGWFMIAGADPPAAGCWSVTASYRGTNLTYVYWSEPGLWTAATAAEGGRLALLEGAVDYDAERSCVVVRGEDGVLRPVVWPAGTSVTDDGRIRLADGRELDIGDRISGTGGAQPVEGYLPHPPPGCHPDATDVFVMWQVDPAG